MGLQGSLTKIWNEGEDEWGQGDEWGQRGVEWSLSQILRVESWGQ